MIVIVKEFMLRGAERIWPMSGEARSADRERGGAQRCQMARAWPRAAQHKSVFLVQDLVLDNYFCSLMGCEYVKKV